MKEIRLTKFLINEDNFYNAFDTVIKDIEDNSELTENAKVALLLSAGIIVPRMRDILFGEEKESEHKC
jgi:hypothetical protein